MNVNRVLSLKYYLSNSASFGEEPSLSTTLYSFSSFSARANSFIVRKTLSIIKFSSKGSSITAKFIEIHFYSG